MHRITGPDLPQNALLQLRTCPVCGKNIAAVVKSFASKDEALAWLDDDADREDFPVLSLPCPECDPPDAERYATHSVFIVGGEVVGEPIELGTASVPVVVRPDNPAALLYSATVDEDEGRRLDAANLTFAKYPPAVFDGFVRAYIRDTLHFRRFDEVIKTWSRERWETAFAELGLPVPKDGRYRKAAREHAEAVLDWHMRGLIRRVQYTTLAVFGERGYRDYDAWTVQYFVLHVPLPEDLEPVRTELIGRFVSRPDHGSEALFRRLRELQGRLDEQRRKVGELRARLDEARRNEAELQRKLSEAYERIRTLEARLAAETIVAVAPRPEDRRRERYRALIAALRADVERLEAALRKAGVREEIVVEEEAPPPAETGVDAFAVLAGKTILVVGGDRAPEAEGPVRLVHHPGYTKEGLDHMINLADIIVIITTHISHGLFWYVRDEALERDKPVIYTPHTNGEIILRRVAAFLGKSGER